MSVKIKSCICGRLPLPIATCMLSSLNSTSNLKFAWCRFTARSCIKSFLFAVWILALCLSHCDSKDYFLTVKNGSTPAPVIIKKCPQLISNLTLCMLSSLSEFWPSELRSDLPCCCLCPYYQRISGPYCNVGCANQLQRSSDDITLTKKLCEIIPHWSIPGSHCLFVETLQYSVIITQ